MLNKKIHKYIKTHIHNTYIHTYINTHTYIHTYIYIHTHTNVRTQYIYMYIHTYLHICKAVPFQAWSGPEGSRKLRFPDFMTTAQDGGKVVSLKHLPSLSPGNDPGTHFY